MHSTYFGARGIGPRAITRCLRSCCSLWLNSPGLEIRTYLNGSGQPGRHGMNKSLFSVRGWETLISMYGGWNGSLPTQPAAQHRCQAEFRATELNVINRGLSADCCARTSIISAMKSWAHSRGCKAMTDPAVFQ